jgi:rifampin ADP-ribosylating transferase
VVPPPYPNPEYRARPKKDQTSEGGQHGHLWYHGTHFSPEEEDEGEQDPVVQNAGGRLRTPEWDHYSGEHADKHWNTDLGVHFTSLHHVARDFFAKPKNGDIDSRVAHASLHMQNPRHFDSEHDMTHDAIEWAQKNGIHYLPKDERAHEHFENGFYEGVADHDKSGAWHELNTSTMPAMREEREKISHIDRHGPSWEEGDPDEGDKEKYLATHPQRASLTEGYRQHLQSQGHDGIVYGNEHEGPKGHISAIAFPETPVAIHKWEWFHPEHGRPADAQESAEQMRMAPSNRQLKLFGSVPVPQGYHREYPETWGKDYTDYAREKPHAAAVGQAQEHMRMSNPTWGMQMPDEKSATSTARFMLNKAGHPAADTADVFYHPHPQKGISNTFHTTEGDVGAMLHPDRFDYGTMAHELAHLTHQHELGVNSGQGLSDEDLHGPRFMWHYRNMGNLVARGAGDELYDQYHHALQRVQGHTGARNRPAYEPPKPGPITFDYAHNTEKSPDFGNRYGQDIEPHGRYITMREKGDSFDRDPKRYETGTVTFQNPLHIPFGGGYSDESNWKHQLSKQFDGKTGKDLSDAVREAGHDAIMTYDDYGLSEIVDLKAKQRPRTRTAASYTYRQTFQGPNGYEDRENTIEGPLYHGGRANLGPGDHLTIGRKPNTWGDDGGKSTHNYFTTKPDTAISYAQELGRRGRVYEVEPTGDFKMDHNEADFKTPHPLRVVREVPREEWSGLMEKASKTASSDWSFEHFNPEGGKSWRMFGGPAEEPRRHMMEYQKTPEGKLDFSGWMGAERIDRKAGPEVASRMKEEALRHHDTTEHDPAAQPPPEPEKPKRKVYYHGTTMPDVTHVLPANHHGQGVIFRNETDKDFAYATPNLGHAWEYAQKASDFTGGRPRVYQVRPIRGHQDVEPDPTWDHVRNRSRGNNDTDLRSRHGFEVLREMKAPRHVRDGYTDSEWGED